MERPLRVDPYLDRIRHTGPLAPTAEVLKQLHRLHMLAVPFENLDIHLRVPIELSVPAFYEKIVTQRRGGFCYELNGLFAWLLAEIGFRVTLLSGRVMSSGRLSPEFDHMALLVERDGRWIADVGFGDSFLTPLRAEPGLDDDQGGSRYAIGESAGTWSVLRMKDDVWETEYVFSLTSRRLDEFAERCAFQQTSAESHFTRNTICSLAKDAGRITLAGRRWIATSGGHRDERDVESAAEYGGILAHEFGIALKEREIERIWSSSRR